MYYCSRLSLPRPCTCIVARDSPGAQQRLSQGVCCNLRQTVSPPRLIRLDIGQGLLNQGVSKSALKMLHYSMENLNVSTPSLAMQLCGPGYTSTHTFGVMVASNGVFAPIQKAIQTWANGTCVSFAESKIFKGPASFTSPLLGHTNHTTNSTGRAKFGRELRPRAECRTVQVESGDSCGTLATKCGISGADFTTYNPGSTFCSTLSPKQHVCCSSGTLPDFRPPVNADGSCFAYKVRSNDNCADLAAQYSLTVTDIESFNKNTWGWNGCQLLFIDAVICLSQGTPPFPAPISNAVCGPQKPGSKPPTDGSNIANLNPCPLNACCNIWGQCGITQDFCIDTNTGAPGTAKPGTYGCISNCGMGIIPGDGNGSIKIAYFEGFGLDRDCLFQLPSQIDTSKYSHIHFAFATLTPTYEVSVGNVFSSYQFRKFKEISGPKRILSFGGWTFSNDASTYAIFGKGVQLANRLTMAKNIANFVKDNNLDGVDIDWEYPGAPDLPWIGAERSPDEGANYLAFLVVLKNLLPGKTVSIAAPSSYWYLKQFPIGQMSKIVDYIVFMTYDLHGQWDAHNMWSQDGCTSGTCLRSQVNLTETRQALAMITKAGVPGRKIAIGVTSYGRSFQMAQPGCWGPSCTFTGDREHSYATPGRCTGTAGYVADAEIAEIISGGSSLQARSSRVVASFVDTGSHSDILVYDNNQWVSYMSSNTKKTRSALYAAWGMGGTTDWASDLQTFHAAPNPEGDWGVAKTSISSGYEANTDWSRNGNWTQFSCDDHLILYANQFTASDQWTGLNAGAAWSDAVRIWVGQNGTKPTFSRFVASVFALGNIGGCEFITKIPGAVDDCDNLAKCPQSIVNGVSVTGPGGKLVWDSLAGAHRIFHDYRDGVLAIPGIVSLQYGRMTQLFGPPEDPNEKWAKILGEFVLMGATYGAGIFLKNSFERLLPSLSGDSQEKVTEWLVEQGKSFAQSFVAKKPSEWTAEKEVAFGSYMAQAIMAWAQAATSSVAKLFDGSPESVNILENAISGGKLISGLPVSQDPPRNTTEDMISGLVRAFYGFSIPAYWRASSTFAFILDPDMACTADKAPLREYLTDETMAATGACVDGRQYYLVYPAGTTHDCPDCEYNYNPGGPSPSCTNWNCNDNKFSAPPGLEGLPEFNLTKELLITGSVNTWLSNGKKNGLGLSNTPDNKWIDQFQVDVTSPGVARLPVCSPARAFQSWDTTAKGSSDNYPCDVPPGLNYCGVSTWEGQTTAASPLVTDCLQIIKNIEGDGSTSFAASTVDGQKAILGFPSKDAGSCRFGIETHDDRSVNYGVGGQDVIDIINDAVSKFSWNGRVGAKGTMPCNTLTGTVDVTWGIY
ncbi:killer toxin subunits alpha/beta [Parachaetomium inaequale]|uniref:chitinase n=1 Tax=Parachaetomium inaequale TaxID=2588326 RepID=A0AAN6PAQ9_9PEZI|nr:killer toxin subunits alpha/beta [Parachaetomium inaequale]